MTRKRIIILLSILWLLSMIGMVLGVYHYIDRKHTRFLTEIRENIKSIFVEQNDDDIVITNNDGFFDVAYRYKPVNNYKNIAIPPMPYRSTFPINPHKIINEIDEKKADEWEQRYGDLVSLYNLNWGDDYPNDKDNGWQIIRIHHRWDDEDFIQTNAIFPYKVGLTEMALWYSYTIEDAVDDALEFFTINPKSGFSERFRIGSFRSIWSKIEDCNNKYFRIAENKNKDENSYIRILGDPIYKPEGMSVHDAQLTMPYEYTWFNNEYCRVFIAATHQTHYMIEEKEWAVTEDRTRLLLWFGVTLTLLFMLAIIPMMIKERRAYGNGYRKYFL